jgi:TatD DNase family protein
MGKNNKKNKRSAVPDEEHLILPDYPFSSSLTPSTTIVDTHTHILSTFSAYRSKYPQAKYDTVFEFVRAMCAREHTHSLRVEAIVDVWCEAPVNRAWRELADAALEGGEGKWGGIEYWFVMGKSSSRSTVLNALERSISTGVHP